MTETIMKPHEFSTQLQADIFTSSLEAAEIVEKHFDELYEYYTKNGAMPYGVAKARDGDPFVWLANRLEEEYL
jgi:hypothetical protein